MDVSQEQAIVKEYEATPLPTIEAPKGAILHYGEQCYMSASTICKQEKSVSLGYRGGSHGLSIPLPIHIGGFPIRYNVSRRSGSIQRKNEVLEISRGLLIVTSQRLYLEPEAGHMPISLPLKGIGSFTVFHDGAEVWVAGSGSEKQYLFEMGDLQSQVLGLCLNQLLNVKEA